jgi:hypothetical protein
MPQHSGDCAANRWVIINHPDMAARMTHCFALVLYRDNGSNRTPHDGASNESMAEYAANDEANNEASDLVESADNALRQMP